jgi:hypothetical protein
MNAERLHTVAKAMLEDLAAAQVERRLETLTSALQQLATQAPNPAYQQALGGHPKPAIDGHLKTGH